VSMAPRRPSSSPPSGFTSSTAPSIVVGAYALLIVLGEPDVLRVSMPTATPNNGGGERDHIVRGAPADDDDGRGDGSPVDCPPRKSLHHLQKQQFMSRLLPGEAATVEVDGGDGED
jgi:hypothetical protein